MNNFFILHSLITGSNILVVMADLLQLHCNKNFMKALNHTAV